MHFQRFFIHGCSNMAGLVVLAFEVRPLAFTTGSLTQECFMTPPATDPVLGGAWAAEGRRVLWDPQGPPQGMLSSECSHVRTHTRTHTHTHTQGLIWTVWFPSPLVREKQQVSVDKTTGSCSA